MSSSMMGFNNDYLDLTTYNIKYFEEILNIFKTRDILYAKSFANNLFPYSEDFDFLIKKVKEILDSIDKNKEITLMKIFSKKLDYLERVA